MRNIRQLRTLPLLPRKRLRSVLDLVVKNSVHVLLLANWNRPNFHPHKPHPSIRLGFLRRCWPPMLPGALVYSVLNLLFEQLGTQSVVSIH